MQPNTLIGETAWGECESAIRAFEDAWRGPARPDVGAFVPPGAPHPTRLLVELVHVDLEFRLRAGEDARAEDYLARFPALAAPELAVELLAAEFALRNRHRPPAWPEEFWLRFPELSGVLRARFPIDGRSGWLSATRPAEPAAEPLVGLPNIPGYEINGELGRGGMGVVYRARDRLLNREVAVKTFAAVPRADACARFAREAEAMAGLDHPHIVPVYEVGEWHPAEDRAAVPFFVMKLYPGGSMSEAPAGPGSDVKAHARNVESIARAVHHAHQRGVLHRDLKPSNILLDDRGRPHVADFGLAGRVGDASAAVVAGTPAYMAPEQARDPQRVSTAADVYGLGAVLLHQLTGRPPFAAETPLATLDRVAHDPPPDPASVNPAVDRDLSAICLKCLEKNPADRYASAGELADDLERWRARRPVAARPLPAWGRAWRHARRHPVVGALVATVLATLVGSVAVLAESNARIREKEAEVRAAYLRECATRYRLEETLAREQRSLYLERIAAAGRRYAGNQLPQAWALLDQCPDGLRGWEWRYLDAVRRADAVVLRGHADWVSRAAFLADGRVATADSRGAVKVWDPERRAEVRTWTAGRGPVSALAAHPTRPWLVVADADSVGVWDAGTGARIAAPDGQRWAAFSPDGAVLAASGPSTVRLWAVPADPAERWNLLGELRGHGRPLLAGAFTPDGKQLMTAGIDGTVRTWNPTSMKEARVRSAPGLVVGLAFADEGRLLAEAVTGAVRLVDPRNGELRDRFDLPGVTQPAVASGPDPALLAVNGAGGEVTVWDVRRRVGQVLRGHTSHVAAVALGPGGRVATGGTDLTVRLWTTGARAEVRTLAEVGAGPGALATSADGRWLAAGVRQRIPGDARQVLVLDAATGRVAHKVPGGPGVTFGPHDVVAVTRPESVAVWDLAAGKERWSRPFPGSPDPRTAGAGVPRPRLSPSGELLATGDGRGGVVVWDAADGTTVARFDTGAAFAAGLEFLPDGRLLVATRTGVTVRNPADGARVPWGEDVPGAVAMALSRDGRWLATVDTDRAVRLREAATGRVARTLLQGPTRVEVLAFSPDGARLLTGGADRAVRVWDVESGQELLSLLGVEDVVTAVAWSADGHRVYALDGSVREWRADPP